MKVSCMATTALPSAGVRGRTVTVIPIPCHRSGESANALSQYSGGIVHRHGSAPRSRMSGLINLQEMLRIDVGVALRGGKRRMSEQFLDRAEIAAGAQQVRGEGMAQGVRCRG